MLGHRLWRTAKKAPIIGAKFAENSPIMGKLKNWVILIMEAVDLYASYPIVKVFLTQQFSHRTQEKSPEKLMSLITVDMRNVTSLLILPPLPSLLLSIVIIPYIYVSFNNIGQQGPTDFFIFKLQDIPRTFLGLKHKIPGHFYGTHTSVKLLIFQ